MKPLKLSILLLLKLPRWIAIGLPAIGMWWINMDYWYLWAAGAFLIMLIAFIDDPFDGPILRFPLRTYLQSQHPAHREQVEHERVGKPSEPLL